MSGSPAMASRAELETELSELDALIAARMSGERAGVESMTVRGRATVYTPLVALMERRDRVRAMLASAKGPRQVLARLTRRSGR